MIITYTPKITPIYAETVLVPSKDIHESVLFLQKSEGWLKLDVTFKDTLQGIESKLQVDKLRTGYRIKTNTTNIVGTNKFGANGQPFYNKITSNVSLTDELVALTTTLKDNGQYYTNETFNNLEIQEGVFLYTEPVLYLLDESATVSHEFTSKFIKITVTTTEVWEFKAASSVVFTPLLLNAGSVLFPSFYLDKHKYIEGDVRIVDKTEYATLNGNIIQPKDRLLVNKTVGMLSNTVTNTLYTDYYQLSSANVVINYLAKLSSHTFNFNNSTLYLKLTPYMIEQGSASDYDIAVASSVDLSKISCIKSDYFKKYRYKNRPQDYIFLNSPDEIHENDRITFKNYLRANYSIFPSMIKSVKTNARTIYQHVNAHEIPLGMSTGTFDTTSTNFNYSALLLNKTNYFRDEGVSFVIKS